MKNYISFLLALFLFSACQSEKLPEADYTIELEDLAFDVSSWSKSSDMLSLNQTEAELTFKLDLLKAGRYKVQVIASGEGTVWLEDYYNNEDGRTYNITGNMSFNSQEVSDQVIDGSPLNAGKHDFKLHAQGEGLKIDKILLTKMIDHQITPVSMEQSTQGESWQMVWSDEFEGEGLPDSLKWTYDIGNWGWGNNEPQYYTKARLENVRVENGNLIIEAHKNDMNQAWTSARLTTRGKISFLYGKIEFRAKVPATDGTWAAGWLLGDDYRDELSWPYCGEVDILECVGNEIDDESGDGINHASCHTRRYYFKEGTQITATTEVEDMANTYHTYAVEWSPEGILGYVDGEHYFTYDKTGDRLEWPFNEPQNIILNLAMGGGMGGTIDPQAESAQFVIDYVRVYGKM